MKELLRASPEESYWGGVIKSMGLVFGDIGTSPIYTLTIVFVLTPSTPANVMGIVSLIFWTLILLVTVQYTWLAMSLGEKGQGGVIMLREKLLRLLDSSRKAAFAGFLTFLGVSLMLGDGVITPAISILSAVEGILLIPGLEGVGRGALIAIAAVIAILLFSFQRRGTDRVAWTFGPLMLVWFSTLTISGLISLSSMPDILGAVNPIHAVNFFQHNGFAGYIVLSEVILCATGGEALFADMGQLGRWPIIRAWVFVFLALMINYIGQAVYVLRHPGAKHLLFGMIQDQAPFLYIPFLLLAILATVIASQAIISGVFSIVYQGITTRLMPLLKIRYTSSKIRSQIYLGGVNWFLLCAVLFVIFIFEESGRLAAAYGLAVTGSMTITTIMISMIFSRLKSWKITMAVLVLTADFLYLFATFSKIPHGAYWSLVIAAVPFEVMMIWTKGQRMLFLSLRPLDIETFLISYKQIYTEANRITGTGLFFTREWHTVPPYVIHCILRSNIIYERNIFISITRTDEPYGTATGWRNIAEGLDSFEIRAGYREVPDIEDILKKNGIYEKVIFYGIEDIVTRNPIWHVFSFMKKVTPNFVQFHKLPAGKLQGIVTRLEI
jgi:KUP system potassium uptake protein